MIKCRQNCCSLSLGVVFCWYRSEGCSIEETRQLHKRYYHASCKVELKREGSNLI
uniref:Uncharacterized protein n=1 Tax=Arundo donax TaxID=35708 RepID=A0A0A9EEN8_ARUDO